MNLVTTVLVSIGESVDALAGSVVDAVDAYFVTLLPVDLFIIQRFLLSYPTSTANVKLLIIFYKFNANRFLFENNERMFNFFQRFFNFYSLNQNPTKYSKCSSILLSILLFNQSNFYYHTGSNQIIYILGNLFFKYV